MATVPEHPPNATAENQPAIDHANVREALRGLENAWLDADFITEDMLLPPRERAMGPATHHGNYKAAKKSLEHGLNYLMDLFQVEDAT